MYLKIGDIAPDFKLINYNDKVISLSDFKDTQIILWFFPKANTPGWTVQGCGFRDKFKQFTEHNIQVIGVSADSPAKQRKFVEKYSFPFPMLCDESKNMLKSYQAWGLKKFMGKEYEGIHRISYLIKDGLIKHVFDKVKTKTHAEDVLNEIS